MYSDRMQRESIYRGRMYSDRMAQHEQVNGVRQWLIH
jgi:hypothetical protein